MDRAQDTEKANGIHSKRAISQRAGPELYVGHGFVKKIVFYSIFIFIDY